MKKVSVLVIAMFVMVAPFAFANAVCDNVDSSEYLKATGAKFVRGVGNVALSWVELFRQPNINENKWEGVGRGVLHTGVRAVAGAGEAVTAIIPGVKIPQPDPPCPTDLVQESEEPASAETQPSQA
ncbi:MAG: hypothetical protein HY584_04925 [Candidatus Omnitrophica bacterium]|nr:hypothetical protein [Candidatus Omnitrophota bacterium]